MGGAAISVPWLGCERGIPRLRTSRPKPGSYKYVDSVDKYDCYFFWPVLSLSYVICLLLDCNIEGARVGHPARGLTGAEGLASVVYTPLSTCT